MSMNLLKNQRGLTIVELLIAAAVGLILLGGIYQIYISSVTTYRTDDELARLQENGRFAFDFMLPTVRNAGYRGCVEANFVNLLNASTQSAFNYRFGTPVEGFEATSATQWTDDGGTTYSASSLNTNFAITDAVGGSDILVLRGPDPNWVSISSTEIATSATLKVPVNSPGIATNDILMTINCPDAALFAVNSWAASNGIIDLSPGASTPGNASKFDDVGVSFPAGTEIIKNATTVFYVRDKDAGAAVEPALYRKVLDGVSAAEELVEGVENMQILYGVDTDNDHSVNSYVTASAVTNWDQVIAVRIGLLVRSVDEIGKLPPDTRTYAINGATVDPLGNGTPAAPVDDRRLRQVFVTTVRLRNVGL